MQAFLNGVYGVNTPLRRTPAVLRLMRFDLDLVPADTKPYFRDVYDHAVRINEMVDTFRELLATALDANLSIIPVSRRQAPGGVAAIIALPTAIAGIYGMNFQFMPELEWRFGYAVALGIVAVVCSGLWLGFKRFGWPVGARVCS